MSTVYSLGRSGVVAYKFAEEVIRYITGEHSAELYEISEMELGRIRGSEREVIFDASFRLHGEVHSFNLDFVLWNEVGLDWNVGRRAITFVQKTGEFNKIGLHFDGRSVFVWSGSRLALALYRESLKK